jgi:hypothetical protein
MSERIYPKGFHYPNHVFDTTTHLHALPTRDRWPTMLGLLTIISDAIAAAPWWGDGAGGVELPAVGSVWVARPGRSLASPHVTVTAVEPPVGVAQARVGTVGPGREWVSGQLGNFLHEHVPATVVPTPTADDWIDPAVRLPEVGEWVWWLTKYGNLNCTRHSGTFGGARWAPILVGPPPIPDASEVPPVADLIADAFDRGMEWKRAALDASVPPWATIVYDDEGDE